MTYNLRKVSSSSGTKALSVAGATGKLLLLDGDYFCFTSFYIPGSILAISSFSLRGSWWRNSWCDKSISRVP